MAEDIYDLLLDSLPENQRIQEIMLGLTWTYCKTESVGLAMSPSMGSSISTRTLDWPGSLVNRRSHNIALWLRDWDPFRATIGMAVTNSLLNQHADLQREATPLVPRGSANLAVFEHFRDRLVGKKVVVIGRYPGLDQCLAGIDYTVLERNPGSEDLPDTAAEYVLGEAEWVFLTATTIVNKTFSRLAALSQNANLVLMGPTTPWLPELADFGVDYIAGVRVADSNVLKQTIAEGGGTRIFDTGGLEYCVADLAVKELNWINTAISDTVVRRVRIEQEMAGWYAANPQASFPKEAQLLALDSELSKLDSQFKRLWDARH